MILKTVKIHIHCSVCGFSTEYMLDVNEHGFFVMPDAYCPNDLLLLEQEIRKDET